MCVCVCIHTYIYIHSQSKIKQNKIVNFNRSWMCMYIHNQNNFAHVPFKALKVCLEYSLEFSFKSRSFIQRPFCIYYSYYEAAKVITLWSDLDHGTGCLSHLVQSFPHMEMLCGVRAPACGRQGRHGHCKPHEVIYVQSDHWLCKHWLSYVHFPLIELKVLNLEYLPRNPISTLWSYTEITYLGI